MLNGERQKSIHKFTFKQTVNSLKKKCSDFVWLCSQRCSTFDPQIRITNRTDRSFDTSKIMKKKEDDYVQYHHCSQLLTRINKSTDIVEKFRNGIGYSTDVLDHCASRFLLPEMIHTGVETGVFGVRIRDFLANRSDVFQERGKRKKTASKSGGTEWERERDNERSGSGRLYTRRDARVPSVRRQQPKPIHIRTLKIIKQKERNSSSFRKSTCFDERKKK